MENNLIELENVRVQKNNITKIESVTWQQKKGEAWLVIGPNGGGKADFLAALCGQNEFISNSTNNRLDYEFQKSSEIVSLERAASLIQEERDLDETEYMDRIDEGRSARRFIAEVLGGPDAKHRNLPLPEIAGKLEFFPEVKLCGIEKILDRGLKFLSTGEIRRTLLCRALLSQKKLLILSDPFAGLDAQSRKILLEFFQTIVAKQNTSSIILAMERYSEIPETITNVLEFTNSKISFCGLKKDYEKLLEERKNLKEKTRQKEKSDFQEEVQLLQKETSIQNTKAENLQSEESSSTDGGKKVLLKMNNVNVGWNEKLVLKNLNWKVNKNEHWLIRGPNGSGKTTLLELITGDNKQVYSNEVYIFGIKRGSGESIWDIKAKLGIVSYRLHVEYRMVGSTDLESVIISGFHDSIGLYQQKSDIEVAAAKKWLKLAGFEGRGNESFNSLSYGEQRAILIIRAAVKNPEILILDEPCHGLDENYRQKILDLLETIAETGTTTFLHVTHDPTEYLEAEKHILELHPNEDPMYKIIETE